MADGADSVDGPEMEQIKIVLNTLYLCIAFAMTHIAKHEGAQAASISRPSYYQPSKAATSTWR